MPVIVGPAPGLSIFSWLLVPSTGDRSTARYRGGFGAAGRSYARPLTVLAQRAGGDDESGQGDVNDMADWKANLLETDDQIRELLATVKRIAVLGIKTEDQADQAAFYVPQALAQAGVEVVPVPVYYPDVKTILGKPVYRSIAEVPGALDLVDVFRKPSDVARHVDELVQKKPRAVWLQKGIRNDAAAERLAQAGIQVVQDRCLMVDW
jgi:uncharacterized protein